ncbi:histidinol dehydrogenase [Plasmopara halstedii]|uniref:Histidinol dehydrogenase n=1 Tax=Plasmopara halstedii TaxID=4781 RepID=A0A0P1ALC3_PLAHL|nr:histidinol dehydrogenase [Plasmopara halstedii]CEG41480.1 histidinol dehydrogenase [Plasmopara halstedii]|eukprot:XP_024577849.1 histidinol dehydrogenase [Plasmopara halstedii]
MASLLKQIEPVDVASFAYDPVDASALKDATIIVNDVRVNGEKALKQHAVRLGDIPSVDTPLLVSQSELAKAFAALPENEQLVLQRTAQRIKVFAQAQRHSISNFQQRIEGGFAGQDVSPMNAAGCYAPGGRYPLPSSVLMTAVTAKVAGVTTVVVASPRPARATLAAAYLAGADYFLAAGGAQAIAAMAYGVGGIPACDIIVGPGNKWVTAAKSLVFGKCAIDMLAGPSECLVIADESADAATIAADLLAQAEHDTAAVPILVTTSQQIIDAVNEELKVQLATLPSAPIATISVQNGFAVLCADMATCVTVSDLLAPEHLEVITSNAREVANQVSNYGGLFINGRAAEVFGDYGAGPNHVLPTGGTARYTGGLSVHTFLRIRTWMRIDDAIESQKLVLDSALLARMEGLEGHARAAEKRLL